MAALRFEDYGTAIQVVTVFTDEGSATEAAALRALADQLEENDWALLSVWSWPMGTQSVINMLVETNEPQH